MDIVEHLRACAHNLSLDLGAGNCNGAGWREMMNTFADAADDIERLRTELEKSNKYADHLGMSLRDVKKDAERYRWFREVLPNTIFDSEAKEIYLRKSLSLRDWHWTGEQLDAAIDAAMKDCE